MDNTEERKIENYVSIIKYEGDPLFHFCGSMEEKEAIKFIFESVARLLLVYSKEKVDVNL